MNSIIDNQRELRPVYFVVDEQFINKRAIEQIGYMRDVIRSSRDSERKLLLLSSSQQTLFNLLSSFYGPIQGCMLFALSMVQLKIELCTPEPHYLQGRAKDYLLGTIVSAEELIVRPLNAGIQAKRNVTNQIFIDNSIT